MDRPIEIPVTLTLDESVYLMQRLAKMPFDEVCNLLPKLKAQIDAAVSAHQQAAQKIAA